jgi:GNAT superfamily N-acetyltransferase
MFHIRSLTLNDLEAADRVISSSFKTASRLAELEGLVKLEKTIWLAGEADGVLVGMVGAIDYGSFAYIGMMGVHADHQRRGFGKALMLALLEQLEQAGQPCTLLDASEYGAPLYAQIGYSDLHLAHVFKRVAEADFQSSPLQIELLGLTSLSDLMNLDPLFFGANRSHVLLAQLSRYPGRFLGAYSAEGSLLGYALAQNKRIGPWVASTPGSAASLLKAALQLEFGATPEVILPSPNQAGRELLEAAGFELQHSLRHMGRGCSELHRGLEGLYGQSSFMLG